MGYEPTLANIAFIDGAFGSLECSAAELNSDDIVGEGTAIYDVNEGDVDDSNMTHNQRNS